MATPKEVSGAQVEVLYDASHELGEGALWCGSHYPPGSALLNKFIYIDIYGPSKLADGPSFFVCDPYAPGGATIEAFPLPEPVGTVVPDAGGNSVVVALKSGFARLDLLTKALTMLAKPDAEHHPSDLRFNDGKCSPDGRFFCGTMKMKAPRATDDLPIPARPGKGEGGLYRMDKDGSMTRVLPGISIANGLAWSLDGSVFYYIDTPCACVFAFDYDAHSGSISGQRVAFMIPEGTGWPDGMCIDSQGRLWVAQWEGCRVVCYEPSTGAISCIVRLPTAHVSSCTFAGPAGGDLIITTAKENMSEETRAAQPAAGHTFIVRGIGAQGAPGFAYAGGA